MKTIWFSADTHYSHANVISLCNRPFCNIYEHDQVLIQNDNSVVSNEDDYYFLGDFAFRCSAERVLEIIKRLNFRKMYFLFGNHDKAMRQAIQRGMLDKEINNGKIEIIGGKEPITDTTIAISKMLDINGQKIFISHYGHRTWPGAFRNCIHLYGHSHSNLLPLYKSMDVGVDCHNFFPISFEEILFAMNNVKEEFSEKVKN